MYGLGIVHEKRKIQQLEYNIIAKIALPIFNFVLKKRLTIKTRFKPGEDIQIRK
jgi:hypothetical protein